MKRNEVNICLRKAKSKYYQNLLDENIQSPDRFWKVIKRVYPAKNKQSLPSKSFKVNSELTSDQTLITNGFANFFTEIVPKLKKLLLPLNSVIWRKGAECENFTFRTFKFRYVSVLSVQKHLKNLQRAKACDLDQLPQNLLKDAANEITPSLTYITNFSLTTSTVPADWKMAKVSPIYKSGSTTELENYRPISVLPIVSKIMEREVHRQLYEFLDETKLVFKHQFGFQKKKLTELAAIALLVHVRFAADNGNLVGACFIDLQKAFDTISNLDILSICNN